MSKVITMYVLADEPVSEVQMIAIDGDTWFKETSGDTFMDNLVDVAEHAVMYGTLTQTPVEYVIAVATRNDLLHVLPPDVLAAQDEEVASAIEEGVVASGDRYHINLLLEMFKDGKPHILDPSEQSGIVATLERVAEAIALTD